MTSGSPFLPTAKSAFLPITREYSQAIIKCWAKFKRKRETALEKIRVLIVDDSSQVRSGLQGILRPHPDIEVVGEATDGLEAITTAEQLQPDVILMDAQMPEMDGIEATRRIKEKLPSIKILFLTVHSEFIDAALAAGADGYLLKDSGRQELLQAIRKLGRHDHPNP